MNAVRIQLQKWATIGWVAILFQMIAAEFFLEWGFAWDLIFLEVLVWEFAGLFHPGKGDLGTDNIRAFMRGGWSRGFLVSAVVLWACFRFAAIGLETGAPLPWLRIIIAAGAAGWLIPHFLKTDGGWG